MIPVSSSTMFSPSPPHAHASPKRSSMDLLHRSSSSTESSGARARRRSSLAAVPPPPPSVFPLGSASSGRTLSLFILGLAVTLATVAAQSGTREFRSFDGSGNNLQNPRWGTVDQPYIRSQVTQTANFSAAAVANLRVLSNGLARSERDIKNVRQLTVLHTFWGEFLIHDIAHVTSSRAPADRATVNVPEGDRFLPPGSNFSFFRAIASGQGPQRIPINVATSYIDGSHVRLVPSLL
ncbi:hypothetical protein BCR44DRAFT_305558 [Catenaria anguillulae PL171]|uniref:Heme peroxidase n=1 Tax=Catenaria anguillulae PL171 TaxID=765915 RepID=A0A1Y2I756_9FUNG|nr:hypothetical protein BCR44DRAFT_305558 [Catenaria anguillulae PL171]